MIDLSIIVVNWNVRDLLKACLTSIYEHNDLEPGSWEVFVVDNHSSDDSVEMVRSNFPDVKLIANEENLGFGRANNQAFEASRGRYILLLNPDTELRPDAVRQMFRHMEDDPETGLLGARLVNPDGSFQRSAGGALPTLNNTLWHYFFLYDLLPQSWGPLPTFLREDISGTFDIGWVSGAALMLRRDAFDTRIFDPRFFLYGEDLELCHRVQSSGWRVRYTSDASVMHHLRRSVFLHGSEETLAAAIKGNRAYFRLTHGPLKTWFYDLILSIGYLARWPASIVYSALKPKVDCSEMIKANRTYAFTSLKLLLGRKET